MRLDGRKDAYARTQTSARCGPTFDDVVSQRHVTVPAKWIPSRSYYFN